MLPIESEGDLMDTVWSRSETFLVIVPPPSELKLQRDPL